MVIQKLMVFLVTGCVYLDLLYNVVAILVHNKSIKVISIIFQKFIEKPFLFSPFNGLFQALLNKNGALLVNRTFKGHILNHIKSQVIVRLWVEFIFILLSFSFQVELLVFETLLRVRNVVLTYHHLDFLQGI